MRHAATPWSIGDTSGYIHTILDARGGKIAEVLVVTRSQGGVGTRSDPTFIVQACNAHANLLGALKLAVLAAKDEDGDYETDWYRAALEAVAQATRETRTKNEPWGVWWEFDMGTRGARAGWLKVNRAPVLYNSPSGAQAEAAKQKLIASNFGGRGSYDYSAKRYA